jgi:hypothetical protein
MGDIIARGTWRKPEATCQLLLPRSLVWTSSLFPQLPNGTSFSNAEMMDELQIRRQIIAYCSHCYISLCVCKAADAGMVLSGCVGERY